MALIEVRNVRQIPGESTRRWFSSRDFDLIVWISEEEGFIGFELCYDKMRLEHALVWTKAAGFRHMTVDDGEHRPGKHKASPILVSNGFFDVTRIHSAFAEESRSLPTAIATFVLHTLEQHPNFHRPT